MVDDILTVLSVIGSVKMALELAATVSRYVSKNTASRANENIGEAFSPNAARRKEALEATYNEWKRIAISLQPSLRSRTEEFDPKTLHQRSSLLANLIEKGAANDRIQPKRELERMSLRHTGLVRTPDGKLTLCFGLSEQTSALYGDAVDVPTARRHFPLQNPHRTIGDHQMPLPVFKVTMLGDSGCGKTVFMSSMYTKMTQNLHQIAIRALSNDIDLELVQHLKNIYSHDKWPPGTASDLKQYDFELLLRGEPIARIEWADYRGGAIYDSEGTPEATALNKRLKESHSIIWMIDMSRLTGPLGGTIARLNTGMSRLSSLSLCAAAGTNHFRSIQFVRSKSDLVRDAQGEVQWNKACEELISHLGETLDLHKVPFCAVIPVSSVGRVDNQNQKKALGDEPHNVEWPLILSLAFMLYADLERLDHHRQGAEEKLRLRQRGARQLVRTIIGLGPSTEEWKAAIEYSEISKEMYKMKDVIDTLLKETPNTIKVYKR